MPFVLRRTDQGGGYVAPPGSHKSYTKDVAKARQFPTREAADADRCVGNEVVEDLDEILARKAAASLFPHGRLA